ncbi:MAG: DUF6020 family protein [Lactobacillaceae bacterium]|jgi:hypothetical protein|nr:DUF6020 family protein [Lactobacillaceae bacterium]
MKASRFNFFKVLQVSLLILIPLIVGYFLSIDLQTFLNTTTSQLFPFEAINSASGETSSVIFKGDLISAVSTSTSGILGFLFAGISFFIWKIYLTRKPKFNLFVLAFSILITVITVIGNATAIDFSIDVYTKTGSGHYVFITQLIGYFLLYFPLSSVIWNYLSGFSSSKHARFLKYPNALILMMIGLTLRVVFLVIMYPGLAHADTVAAISEFLKMGNPYLKTVASDYSSGQPAPMVWLFGALFKLFKGAFGWFFIDAVQSIAFSSVIFGIAKYFKKWEVNAVVTWVVTLVLAVSPFWIFTSIAAQKDMVMAIAVAWAMLIAYDSLRNKKVLDWRIIVVVLLAIFISFTRSTGPLVALPFLLAFLIAKFVPWIIKELQNRIIKLTAIGVLILVATTAAIFMGTNSRFQQRILGSYPNFTTQQMARVFARHYDQIPQKIKEEILPAFDQTTALRYSPVNSDPVASFSGRTKIQMFKDKYGNDGNIIYWSTYLRLNKMFPGEYLSAFFDTTSNAYYPFKQAYYSELPFAFTFTEDIYKNKNIPWSNKIGKKLQLNKHITDFKTRAKIMNDAWHLSAAGPLSIPSNIGLLAWAMVLIIFYLIQKKKWVLFVPIAPVLIAYLVNLSVPVNGMLRYFYPFLLGMPIIIGLMFINKEGNND